MMKQKEAMEASAAMLRWCVSQNLDECQCVEVMALTTAFLITRMAKRDKLQPHGGIDRVHQIMMEQVNMLEKLNKKKAKK